MGIFAKMTPRRPKPAGQVSTSDFIVQLKTALPDSTAKFRERCIETGLTISQAKDAWTAELGRQVASQATVIIGMEEDAVPEEQAKEVEPRRTGNWGSIRTGVGCERKGGVPCG